MQNAEKNRAALVASDKKIAANSVALADHEQRIETLEQSNSSNFERAGGGLLSTRNGKCGGESLRV